MDAAAGQGVEIQRPASATKGLAFAGLHLGDLALVEDYAADELDVEVAHPEGSAHGLPGGCEDLRQDLVHRGLELFLLVLAAFLGQLPAALQFGMMALVLRGLLGFGGVADLLADFVDEGPDLFIRALLHLRFQLVRAFDERLDPPDFAVVRVDEATQEAKH